jgi:hypothetical protein
LERLQTLESNLKLVLVGKLGGVVDHIDPEKGDDRHLGGVVMMLYRMTVNKSRILSKIVLLHKKKIAAAEVARELEQLREGKDGGGSKERRCLGKALMPN